MSSAGRLRNDALNDIISAVEDYGARVEEVMTKAADALSSLYGNMFPQDEVPTTLRELAEVFCVEPGPLLDYSRAQTICGAETALTLCMAHGVQGDFDKVASEFPKGADGREVVLTPFARRARPLAKRLAKLLEQRAAGPSAPAP